MFRTHGYNGGSNGPYDDDGGYKWRGRHPVAAFTAAVGLPSPRIALRPPPCFDPAPWNEPAIIHNANCYGYALNIKDWVHIGDLALRPSPGTTSVYFNKVVADGLHPAPRRNPPPVAGHYLVAMVSGQGWHWYRQDSDGTWSHKMGELPATNRDASGKLITNPLYADRGRHINFEGFFYVPQDGVTGEGRTAKGLTPLPCRK